MAKVERRGKGAVASIEVARKGFELADDETKKIESFAEGVAKQPEGYEVIDEMQDLLKTPFYTLNKSIPAFRQAMLSPDPRHWGVQWFFPNAIGGAVYVDYPRSKHEFELCKKKSDIMLRLGLTYKIFRPESERKFGNAVEMINAIGDDEFPNSERAF